MKEKSNKNKKVPNKKATAKKEITTKTPSKKRSLYDHLKIEKKWQKFWETKKMYQASDTSTAKKFYPLVEFPFPSGAGLHTGHIRSYTAMDIVARKHRMQGENVLYPIGWDAFGLPTENYAIKTGIQPKIATKQNTDTFRRQLKSLGVSFDWSREVNTTDPEYYKWTQWIFLKMFEAGLAYKAKATVNWCPKDKTGLANEEVVNGCCERCGTPVEKREKEQWMLAITKYADRLDKDLDDVDYLEKIKIQQRNWIGKSEGSEIDFKIKDHNESVKVFTTRPDTLFGVTYIVLAPEHSLVSKLLVEASNKDEIKKYIAEVKNKPEIERTAEGKEKTGVELKGVRAINPVNKEEIPVWIADYVLASYGTGAVMAVPAHDDRDWDFAQKYNLPVKYVIAPYFVDDTPACKPREDKEAISRRTILAIVKHWKEDKYLCLDWKQTGWKTFITGGVDKGEDLAVAAEREVIEETGFKNLKFISVLGGSNFNYFYAPHKDVNRLAEFSGVFFELKDGEQGEVSDEEKKIHDLVWTDRKDVEKFLESGKSSGDQSYLFLYWNRLISKRNVWTGDGKLINSGSFDGMESEKIKKEITLKAGGKLVTKFKLRDWVFSRQRYWGEPIPLVNCERCGWVAVPEKDLPLKLPAVKKYEPTDNGESPLATVTSWVNTKCPRCKGLAKRETDTMPQWAGSSWYYLRYADPKNKKDLINPKNLALWQPVDWYNGGMEHTTLHLLYSRFWHKFLFDIGIVKTIEPYKKRTSHGLILAEGGEKMSKSKGNVVSPDELIKLYGADTLRLYEMFMGPFDQAIMWNSDNMIGPRRFIERLWNLAQKVSTTNTKETQTMNRDLDSLVHKTIKKVGDDIESMGYNTAVSSLMILLNALEKETEISQDHYETLLILLAPFSPHVTEELWASLGNKKSIHTTSWPSFDPAKLEATSFTIMVQINGKVRASFVSETNEEVAVKNVALNHPDISKRMEGKIPDRVIYVPGKLVNIVIHGL